MQILSGGLLSLMIDIGHRTGLFAAAAEGWATSDQLAARAGLTERYDREWLGAMTTAGIVEYDQSAGAFLLPPEHACMLTSPTGVGPLAVSTTIMAKHVPQIVRAFCEGGGVPYAAFGPEWTDAWDAVGRGVYDTMLVSEYLPLAPGLSDLLTEGAQVADIACGTGHALIVLARAFPTSTFTGYDLDEHAVARARAEAAGGGLANVRFEVADVARLTGTSRFDVIFVFDAIHDQAEPDTVIAQVRSHLLGQRPLQHGLGHLGQQPVRAEQLHAARLRPGQQLIGQLRADHRRQARFPVVSVTGHRCSVCHRVSFREPPFLRLIVRPRHLHSR